MIYACSFGYPKFYNVFYISDNVSKMSKRMLDDDVASGKIIGYTQRSNGSYDVLKLDLIKAASKKASQFFYSVLMITFSVE